MFEIYAVDEYGYSYVAAAYDSAQEAKEALEDALDRARTVDEAFGIRNALCQVYEELAS
jgi:hypothetical protein